MPARPTLYDDWKARREHLASLADPSGDNRTVEAAVLDFLLRRYRDTAEGARPARFALQRKFYVNHRAIVVLHHLAGGRDTKVATEQQAQARVRAILTRMSRTSARKKKMVPRPAKPAAVKREWKGPDEALRMRLCDNNPLNRLLAIVKLSEIGTLHDIGLFLDLLSLAATLDEHPKERAAMLHAMQRLAGLTAKPFNLTEVFAQPGAPTKPGEATEQEESPPEILLPNWKCPTCGSEIPGNFQICWNCENGLEG